MKIIVSVSQSKVYVYQLNTNILRVFTENISEKRKIYIQKNIRTSYSLNLAISKSYRKKMNIDFKTGCDTYKLIFSLTVYDN